MNLNFNDNCKCKIHKISFIPENNLAVANANDSIETPYVNREAEGLAQNCLTFFSENYPYLKSKYSYTKEPNKLYSFNGNSTSMTIAEKKQPTISSINASLIISNEHKSKVENRGKSDLRENVYAKEETVLMDIEGDERNKHDSEEQMTLDFNPEEYLIVQEKRIVEKIYEEKNKKIMDLFLNGNK